MYRDEAMVMGPGGTLCTYDKTIGCRSSNVIYGIWCEICKNVIYVGETGGILYQRIQNHLSTIRCRKLTMEVAQHFNGEGHGIGDMLVVGLEKVWKNWVSYRRVREQRWISLLGTLHSTGGLNKMAS